MSKFRSLVEIKRIDPKDVKKTASGEFKVLKNQTAYMENSMLNSKPLLEKEKETTYDLRLREKFITRGNWSVQEISDFEANMPESPNDVVPFKSDQPAIGLFDEETLKRVQKNFPYTVKNKNGE